MSVCILKFFCGGQLNNVSQRCVRSGFIVNTKGGNITCCSVTIRDTFLFSGQNKICVLTLSLLYANEVNLLFSCSKLRLTGNFEIEIKIYMLSRFLGQDMDGKNHRNKDKWLLYCLL